MESASISRINFSMTSNLNEDPVEAKPLPPNQGTYSIVPCNAPGLMRCVPKVEVPPAETLWKFIAPPWVPKTKLFHCEPPPPPTPTPTPGRSRRKGSQISQVSQMDVEEEQSSDQSSPPTMVEEMQLEEILAEVKRIKERVGEVDRQLGTRIPECPDIDPCVDMDVELLAFNTSPDILELQRNSHKLRQQLAELQLCRVATDSNVKAIRESICREMENANRLQKLLNELDSFKRKLEREQALCRQRFRYVEQVKVDGAECNNYFSSERKLMEYFVGKLVTKADYQQQKRRALKEIDFLKLKAKKFHDHLFYATDKLDAVMGTVERMHPPELLTFLYRNEKLFGPCPH
ncbi:GL22059 [Drosophila persimilis]|uniref:GL22059 n=2 Tax=Drosophila persimilis TaxID=7234 RepID=B4GEQ8_DROPE|nr:GL22059 [Drosophila persimilis]